MTSIAQIPTNGLVAYWSFTGNASDNSGNGHNGTVKGAVLTADRFGRPNHAYQFDGNDTIQVSLQQTNVTSYTISAWFKTTYGGIIISGRGLNNQDGLTIHLHSITGGFYDGRVLFNNDGPAKSIGQMTDGTYRDGSWHHVVGVYDGAAGSVMASQFKIYIDNVLVSQTGSQSGSAMAPITNGTDLFIGAHQVWPAGGHFDGTLDDYRIYDRAITANEVTALYNESLCLQNLTVTDTLVINLNVTGFNPISYSNNIKIFPNPTNDQLNISIANSTSNGYQIKILNTLNQEVYQQTISQPSYSVNLNTFSTGTYFVNIIDGSGNLVEVKKIILQ
ncbi:MAG: LamG-like jellyroll fold domain-containing protein [Flavobacteriales bacterium]